MSTSEITDKQAATLDRFLSGNNDLEQLSARLQQFNVFRALGIEATEIRHSNTLGWLLDPDESHGLGDTALRRVLSNILLKAEGSARPIPPAEFELMEFTDIEVRREKFHVDVLVIDHGNKWVLLLENKVHASEGKGQLARYEERVARQFPNFKLIPVFLTPEGRPAEDPKVVDYIAYSYQQLLGVLEGIYEQRKAQMADAVSEFLRQYIETLRRITMQDKELTELCKRIYRKHREAIDLIVQYGTVTCFESVTNDLLKSQGNFEVLQSRPYIVRFLPNSWVRLVPENGIMWTEKSMKRRVSVCCWSEIYHDQIHLVFEVSAMTDAKLRLACVNALKKAGFKLSASALKENAEYSRFYSSPYHKVADPSDEDEVRKVLQELLKKADEQFPKAEAVFKEVFANNPK